MEVYPTTITESGTGNTQAAAGTGSGELTQDDFMLLLMTQLKYQDPMEPMDSESMLNQFTQLNSLEELQNINQNVSDLSSSESLTDASSLIGRQVSVANEYGIVQNGIVSSISQNQNQIELWINDVPYPLSALRSIEQVEA